MPVHNDVPTCNMVIKQVPTVHVPKRLLLSKMHSVVLLITIQKDTSHLGF